MTERAYDPRLPTRPRAVWLVVLLGLLMPGLGHLHVGHGRRGIAWWVGITSLVLLAAIPYPWGLFVLLLVLPVQIASIVDAVRLLRRDQRGAGERPLPRLRVYAAYVVGLVAAIFAQEIVYPLPPSFETFSMSSGSGQPTLRIGDRFLAERGSYELGGLRRGEIILFTREGDPAVFVHRLVGLPGDLVAFSADGHLLLNGGPVTAVPAGEFPRAFGGPLARFEETLPEAGGGGTRYFILRDRAGAQPWPATLVPEGHVFVLGDNREGAADSRIAGPVDIARIIGKARFVYWPGAEGDGERDWSRIGQSLLPMPAKVPVD